MINYNQQLIPRQQVSLKISNRAFKYGDAVFETLKVQNSKIIFSEEHYFRLMSSMRMLRMKIPMFASLEFFEDQILRTIVENSLQDARVRFSVFRKDGGLYLPKDNEVDFLIEVHPLNVETKESYRVDLFKDFEVSSSVLSTIKTVSKTINVLASIFAHENNLDNCILLNEKKNIVGVTNANIFLIKGKTVYTPSIDQGCLKGIVRNKIIELIKKDVNYTCTETNISPFELLKADEVFLTNSIIGIQNVTQYRKKSYATELTLALKGKLKILETLI